MKAWRSRFLTVAEVAGILRLNQQTVRNWIDAGKLPAVHVGRRVRIKRSDFDRLISESYTGSSATAPAGDYSEGIWEGDMPLPEAP